MCTNNSNKRELPCVSLKIMRLPMTRDPGPRIWTWIRRGPPIPVSRTGVTNREIFLHSSIENAFNSLVKISFRSRKGVTAKTNKCYHLDSLWLFKDTSEPLNYMLLPCIHQRLKKNDKWNTFHEFTKHKSNNTTEKVEKNFSNPKLSKPGQ